MKTSHSIFPFIGLSLTCFSWILLISSCSYCQANTVCSCRAILKIADSQDITVYDLQRVNEMNLIKEKPALLKKPSRLVCDKSVNEMYFSANLKHIFHHVQLLLMLILFCWDWYCFVLFSFVVLLTSFALFCCKICCFAFVTFVCVFVTFWYFV